MNKLEELRRLIQLGFVEEFTASLWGKNLHFHPRQVEWLIDFCERQNSALRKLHAVVKRECPSLLDEDSCGDALLELEIEDLLKELKEP